MLTAKREAFCQGIADGLTQADAYRRAFNASKMTNKTIWERASVLMADSKVKARVGELRQALSEKLLWKREDSVRVLSGIALDVDDAKPSERVSAVKELNAMHGYNEPVKLDVGLQVLRLGEHDDRI